MMGAALGAISVAGAAIAGYSHWIEPFRIARIHRTICAAGLTRPIRLLHLSDFHLRRGLDKKVSLVRAALPRDGIDLVLLGGDFLDRMHGLPLLGDILSQIKQLQPPLGIYAVKGNHEVFDYGVYHLFNGKVTQGYAKDCSPLFDLFASLNIPFLDNTFVELPGSGSYLIGVHDYFTGRGDAAVAFAGLPDGGFRILLSHSPAVLPDLAGHHADVVFAGHTHGGQFRLPLIGAIASRSPLPDWQIRGCYQIGSTVVSMSNGLGEGKLFPFRFRCPPQIITVDLTPGAATMLTATTSSSS